jgi:hypothetical protein
MIVLKTNCGLDESERRDELFSIYNKFSKIALRAHFLLTTEYAKKTLRKQRKD